MKNSYKLEDILHNRIFTTGRECDLIVMHPKTWQDLIKEFASTSSSFSMYHTNNSLKYKGIRVLRSQDIEEGIFEVR